MLDQMNYCGLSQRITLIMFYRNSQSNDSSVPTNGSSSFARTNCHGLAPLHVIMSRWKYSWCTQFSWIEFNVDIGRIKLVRFKRIEVGA